MRTSTALTSCVADRTLLLPTVAGEATENQKVFSKRAAPINEVSRWATIGTHKNKSKTAFSAFKVTNFIRFYASII